MTEVNTKNWEAQPNLPWKTNLRVFENTCDLGKFTDQTVILDYRVHGKIESLTEEMGSEEWLAYLIGKKFDDGFYIQDLRVPKQSVGAATVEVDEPDNSPDVIGTVHSHHNMGSFHSGTDNEYLVGNHELTLVYSNSGKYACKVRMALPCGHYYAKETEVIIDYPVIKGLEKWIASAKENIRRIVHTARQFGGYGYNNPPTTYGRFCAKCHTYVPWGSGLWNEEEVLYCEKCIPEADKAKCTSDQNRASGYGYGYGYGDVWDCM